MATSFTTTRAASTVPPYQGFGGGTLCVAWGKVTFDTDVTLAAALTVSMCKVPAGATVVGGYVAGGDIDTGTETFDFDAGWAANGGTGTYDAADPDGFGNFGVSSGDTITELIPVAGIYHPLQGVLMTDGPLTFTADTTMQLVFNADANATGTGTVYMVVYYTTP